MERKQRLAMVFAMAGVALGAGHLVQNGAGASAPAAAAPTQITQVSAGPEAVAKPILAEAVAPSPASPVVVVDAAPDAAPAPAQPAPDLPAPVVVADLSPSLIPSLRPPAPAAVVVQPALQADTSPLPQIVPPEPTDGPAALPAAPVATTAPATSITPVPTVAPAVAPTVATAPDACAPTLRLAAAPQAMIGVSLVAPCSPEARVVIGHEGLSITGKTNAEGSLFLSLPALAVEATVTARLPQGQDVSQTVRVPAMATLRRMGVQWQDADAFQLHAFEEGAGYGQPGHVSADKPQMPTTGIAGTGGFMSVLGDNSVDLPLLAEVYTFPAGIAANADIVIEAAVTDATCGRELLGETIMTLAGEVYITELTLAMPDCDAVGDILVLKNLLTDLTIAAAN
jgi:hypothetical protein